MYFKRGFFAFSLLIIACSTFAQTKTSKKEADFITACKGVVSSIYKRDIKKLNAYINPKYGLYTLYSPGVSDNFVNEKKIGRGSPLDNHLSLTLNDLPITKPDFVKNLFKYGKLPQWQWIEDEGVWSKTGFFADTIKKYQPLTEAANFLISNNEGDQYSKKELRTIKLIESQCRKVVFAPDKESGLIFYMIYINSKWYLAIFEAAFDVNDI